jgi:hypothetical protein
LAIWKNFYLSNDGHFGWKSGSCQYNFKRIQPKHYPWIVWTRLVSGEDYQINFGQNQHDLQTFCKIWHSFSAKPIRNVILVCSKVWDLSDVWFMFLKFIIYIRISEFHQNCIPFDQTCQGKIVYSMSVIHTPLNSPVFTNIWTVTCLLDCCPSSIYPFLCCWRPYAKYPCKYLRKMYLHFSFARFFFNYYMYT